MGAILSAWHSHPLAPLAHPGEKAEESINLRVRLHSKCERGGREDQASRSYGTLQLRSGGEGRDVQEKRGHPVRQGRRENVRGGGTEPTDSVSI